MPACVVLVTVPNRSEGNRLAKKLLQEKLVACVNMIAGVTSIFRWNDKVQEAREVLLVMKTTRNRYKAIEKRVKALHSYDVPEVIALPITAGSEKYLTWVSQSVRP